MTTMTTMTTTTAMAASTHMRLLDDDVIAIVHEQGPERRPREEDDLHDAERERGLQHGAVLVQVPRERIVGAHAVGAERA